MLCCHSNILSALPVIITMTILIITATVFLSANPISKSQPCTFAPLQTGGRWVTITTAPDAKSNRLSFGLFSFFQSPIVTSVSLSLMCKKNVSFRSSGSNSSLLSSSAPSQKRRLAPFNFYWLQLDPEEQHFAASPPIWSTSWTEPRYSCLKVVRFVLCNDIELDDDDGRSMQSRTPGGAIRDFYKFNFLGNLRQRTTTNRLGNFTD